MQTYREAAKESSFPPPTPEDATTHERGAAFAVDPWTRLRRFLILGTDTGSYYVDSPTLTVDNARVVRECVAIDGKRVVSTITEVSVQGLAPKNDPALLALAIASVVGDDETRKLAFDAVPIVCRIGTHIFHFVSFHEAVGGGWGRGMKRAIGRWYQMPAADVAYQVTKYQQRDGWSHRDLLRLSHPKTVSADLNALYRYVVSGELLHLDDKPIEGRWFDYIRAVEIVKNTDRVDISVPLIMQHRLPREVIPTSLLNNPDIWEALLQSMPITAMIRNLGKMTSVGLVTPRSSSAKYIEICLGEEDTLRNGRVHPIALLTALKVYQQGRGVKGSLSWTPVKSIVTALDEAFYLAFRTIEPTGKRIRLAIDVSKSMDFSSYGSALTAREVAGAMALVIANTEPNHEIVAFHDRIFPSFPITPSMRLDEVLRVCDRFDAGWTFCSLPIRDARANKKEVDAFVTITDSETADKYIGTRTMPSYNQPSSIPTQTANQELVLYRREMGIDARHAVVAAVANEFSLVDPNDPRQIDVVGFDPSVPTVIADFVSGRV